MFTNQKSLTLLTLIIFCLVSPYWVLAQVTTATISGTTSDETGAVLPGVTLTVTNVDTGATRTVLTNDQGIYHAPQLPAGSYEIQAELPGFQTTVRSGVTLTVGREFIVDIAMQVGEITERVTVTGEAALLETTRSSVSGLVGEQQIRDLPLNGRDWQTLALLQTGVVSGVGNPAALQRGGGANPSFAHVASDVVIGGLRPNGNSFLLDGTDIQSTYWNRRPTGVSGVQLGVDSVREFQVMTSTYSSEFGRAMAGVVNAITRSGTNDYHGSMFYFHRNSALDAKNFFDDPDAGIPPFRRHQYGFSVGGPIAKDRTFFFGNFEGLRESLGVTVVERVLDDNARKGIFPDGTVEVHPGTEPWIGFMPSANGRNFGDGTAEFLGTVNRPVQQDYFTARIDHAISENHSLFGRYTQDDSELSVPNWQLIPDLFYDRSVTMRFVTIEETAILSPTLINVFRYGFNYSFEPATHQTKGDPPPALVMVPQAGRPANPRPGGLSPLGANMLLPFTRHTTLHEIVESVAYNRGSHALKMGVNVKRIHNNDIFNYWENGLVNFRGPKDFVEGNVRYFRAPLPGASSYQAYRQTFFGVFFQDDFNVRPNLTLNLGLRWEMITGPAEKFGHVATLVNPLTDTEMTVTGKVFESNPNLKNFAPRIGFAWTPIDSTTIRAGFGLFHDNIMEVHYGVTSRLNPPFYAVAQVTEQTLGFPVPWPNSYDAIVNSEPRKSPSVVDYHTGKGPYAMQYNFTIQSQLAQSTVLSVGYVGSRGLHLTRSGMFNSAVWEIRDGRKFFPADAPRINPAFDGIRFQVFDANSFYNALQVSLNKRMSEGLQYQVSYTFSQNIDDLSGVNCSENGANSGRQRNLDFWDRTLDRGLSAFHVKHNMNFNYTYELPFGSGQRFANNLSGVAQAIIGGWTMTGLYSVNSGVPLSIRMGVNSARHNKGVPHQDRPDLKPGFSNNPIKGTTGGCGGVPAGTRLSTPDMWFDPCAFQVPEVGYFGNLGPDTIDGPNLASFDLAVLKKFQLGSDDTRELQFRAEFFNLFNTPNFGLPSGANIFRSLTGNPSSGSARISYTIATSRQIQFALKLSF